MESFSNLLIAGGYYAVTAILTFFSVFSVYILLRYGKGRLLSLAIGILYSFFFLTILSQSYANFKTLIQ